MDLILVQASCGPRFEPKTFWIESLNYNIHCDNQGYIFYKIKPRPCLWRFRSLLEQNSCTISGTEKSFELFHSFK